MVDRVPLTLFTHVNTVTPYAAWNDPLNLSDPWNGYTYQWTVDLEVRPQTHSDPTTIRPYTYNGLDVNIGDWLVFTSSGMALEVVSIAAQTDSLLTLIVEDVNLHNLLNDAAQSGQGIGGVSGANVYDCLIINLNSSGVPIFSNLDDYSVPINLVSDITNRFQFRNYIQDYIPGFQLGHNFAVGDVIYIDNSGVYHLSTAAEEDAKNSIGTVTSINQPSVGNFTYRPLGRYVKNLPLLPGLPGDLLYVSSATPGGLTATAPTPYAIPVYIKISNTAGILTSGSGSTGGTVNTGNIGFSGNTIFATNPNGNINLQTTGNGVVNITTTVIENLTANSGSFSNLTQGRVVIVGPNGQLIDSGFFLYDISNNTASIGNINIANNQISSSLPLLLSSNSNVEISSTLDLYNNRIINVEDPENPQDVATKSYVDANASGLTAKGSVFIATVGDLNATFSPLVSYGSLTGNTYERLTIDGKEPALGARILVKNQNDEKENGIYDVIQIGSVSEPWILSRSSDYNGQLPLGEIKSGDFTFVEDGNVNISTGWVMSSPNPVVVNTSNIHWTQFSASGTIQPGFGLTKDGTVLNVNVAAIIDPATGLNATPGPLGDNVIEIFLSSATPLEFYNGALQVKPSIAGTGLTYDIINGNINIASSQLTINEIGNISAGTWSANVITTQYGGTGLSTLGSAGQAIVVNQTTDGLTYENRVRYIESNSPPVTPIIVDGDKWFNPSTGVIFTRITDVNGSHWVEL